MQPIWLWAILGLILLGVEMLTGTFYILWFGIAALCVAMMLVIFPEAALTLQLLAFSALSLVSLAVWKWKYASHAAGLRVGQSRGEEIGKQGRITADVAPDRQGRIAFTIPLMGSQEWTAVSDEPIGSGEEAVVTAIEGNYLRVQRITK